MKRRMTRMSVLTQLIALFLLAVLVPLLVFGSLMFSVSRRQLLDSTDDTLQQSAQEINAVLNAYADQILGIRNAPRSPEEIPAAMMMAAPSPAPADTPRPNGDARGFRSTDCMTVPLTDSAAPVRNANRTLGRRMLKIIAG